MTVIDGAGYEQHTTLPKLNTILLEDVVNWAIESHNGTLPENQPKWHQQVWNNFVVTAKGRRNEKGQFQKTELNFCGTAFCIAGMALQITGSLNNDFSEQLKYAFRGDSIEVQPADTIHSWNHGVVDSHGNFRDDGAAVLGLTYTEASRLFNGDNGIHQVVKYATDIANTRGETLILKEIQ